MQRVRRCLPDDNFRGLCNPRGFEAFLRYLCSAGWGYAMRTMPLPKATRRVHDEPRGPFEGDLLDLYVAILIVVPLSLFLKSLWS